MDLGPGEKFLRFSELSQNCALKPFANFCAQPAGCSSRVNLSEVIQGSAMEPHPDPSPRLRKNESQPQSQEFANSIPIPKLFQLYLNPKYLDFNTNSKNILIKGVLNWKKIFRKHRSQYQSWPQKFGIEAEIPLDWDSSADPWGHHLILYKNA